MKLQHKAELDELTAKCEQLESKCAEKVKECKHVRMPVIFVDFVIVTCILYSFTKYAIAYKRR